MMNRKGDLGNVFIQLRLISEAHNQDNVGQAQSSCIRRLPAYNSYG